MNYNNLNAYQIPNLYTLCLRKPAIEMSENGNIRSNTPSDIGYNSMTQASNFFGADLNEPSPTDQLFYSTPLNSRNKNGVFASTTSEQLAWAFRRARDRLETASNNSNYSNISDRPESNLSSISDVTGYEEELYRIKKFLVLDENPGVHQNIIKQGSKSKTTTAPSNETIEIQNLNFKLDKARNENEQLKLEMQKTEQTIQLVWDQKYQDILRQKAHCEGQLLATNKRIEVLLKDKGTLLEQIHSFENNVENDLQNEIKTLREQMRDLEMSKLELARNLDLSLSESETWKNELRTVEAENQKLRASIKTILIETESKNASVQSLKEKITEQYFENQLFQHEKIKAENLATSAKLELENCKKSIAWYMEQLHLCQDSKKNLQAELMNSQTNYIEKCRDFEMLKIENVRLKHLENETQEKALNEKTALLKQLEQIQTDMVERELLLMSQAEKCKEETVFSIESKSSDQNEKIDELIQENKKLQKQIDIEVNSKNVQEQNVKELIERITVLQKALNEKDIAEQILQSSYNDLKIRYDQLTKNSLIHENNLIELKNEKSDLEIKLTAVLEEKQQIDMAIGSLKDDLFKITQNYNKMKMELREKETLLSTLENEKQHSFMENNWKICEIENLQHKILNSKILQSEMIEVKDKYQTEISKNEHLINDNKILTEKIQNLENNIQSWESKIQTFDELNSEIDVLKANLKENENTIIEMKIKIQQHKEQEVATQKSTDSLMSNLKIRENQIIEKNQQIEELLNDLERKEKAFENLIIEKEDFNVTINDLSKTNQQLSMEIKNYKEDINRFNFIIEQYNILFKQSDNDAKKLQNQLQISPIMENALDSYSNSLLEELKILENKVQYILPQEENNFETLTDETIPIGDVLLKKIKNINLKTEMFLLEKNEFENQIRILNKELEHMKIHSIQLESAKLTVEHKLFKAEESLQNSNFIKKSAKSFGVQVNFMENPNSLHEEVKHLKTVIRVNEKCFKERYKRFENNIRTLLKNIKDHMRARKLAEKNLELANEINNNLKAREETSKKLLANANTTIAEHKNRIEELQRIILDLETEVGKHEISFENQIDLSQMVLCDKLKYKSEATNARLRQMEENIDQLKTMLSSEQSTSIELKKKLFDEERESLFHKKKISVLENELEQINVVYELKVKELENLDATCQLFKEREVQMSNKLLEESEKYSTAIENIQKLHQDIEILKNKEINLLNDIEGLNYELLAKSNEFKLMEQKCNLTQENLNQKEKDLNQNIQKLKIDLEDLRFELASVQTEKVNLQKYCTELRVALQGTVDQNKILRDRLKEASREIRPDITSNLPSPTKFDKTHIANLLELSSKMSTKTPLTNLQNCLDSLKLELSSLQQQVIANTQNSSRT